MDVLESRSAYAETHHRMMPFRVSTLMANLALMVLLSTQVLIGSGGARRFPVFASEESLSLYLAIIKRYLFWSSFINRVFGRDPNVERFQYLSIKSIDLVDFIILVAPAIDLNGS